jgi:choline dehydrogenase
VLRPESRGSVTLRSPDPLAPPVIKGNYYGAENDRRSLREAIRITRRLFAEPAFAPYRGEELAPGAGATSDADLDAFVRRAGYTIFHPVGTCRMGSDPQSVVDGSLKVRGMAGLRVVDASVMPTIIGGNTNAPTIMIAEKAADMIRGRTPPPRAELPAALS